MAEKGRFQGGAMAPDESKFENPLIGSFRDGSARFRARVREPYSQPAFGMKIMAEKGRFQGGAMAPDESKFENPLIGSFRETTVRAHFGRKLQKIFPLPANSSEPENVRVLLRMIHARLDKPPIPGDE